MTGPENMANFVNLAYAYEIVFFVFDTSFLITKK